MIPPKVQIPPLVTFEASGGIWSLLAATEVGGVALLIDANNERAAKWYSSYGAVPLADAPLPLPLATIQNALETSGKL